MAFIMKELTDAEKDHKYGILSFAGDEEQQSSCKLRGTSKVIKENYLFTSTSTERRISRPSLTNAVSYVRSTGLVRHSSYLLLGAGKGGDAII